MQTKKCFGIISYLPDAETKRSIRIRCLLNLLNFLTEQAMDIPIMIIAQNWKNFSVTDKYKQIKVYNYEKALGILQARRILRQKYLEQNYDYLIMLDDDAHIVENIDGAFKIYLQNLNVKDGYCILKPWGQHIKTGYPELPEWYYKYSPAQLNLCAVSTKLLKKYDFPDVDPEKLEGFEDLIYSMLLYFKEYSAEIISPNGLVCTQISDSELITASTWFDWSDGSKEQTDKKYLCLMRSISLLRYLLIFDKFPENISSFVKNITINN